MPPEGDSPAEVIDDPIATAVAEVDAQLAQTSETVRNTPEFKALEKQLRSSARAKGQSDKAARDARTEAETYRQAAEAQRQTALEAELGTLDPKVIETYGELVALGEDDPVAAARRLAELLSTAQSSQAPADEAAPSDTPPEGGTVPASTPPPMGGGVDGNQPLTTPPGEDYAALSAQLDERYASVVARNQDPVTRNRVTMKERAEAMIAYLASSYVKAVYGDKKP